MSSAAEILVVFLSVALAIFITLGIITFVLVIRVTRQIGDVAEKMAKYHSKLLMELRRMSLR